MGSCLSGLVAPDQQHLDFGSFEPCAGSLVLLGTQNAGSNSPTLFLCRDKASGWHWFDAVGYFVESESGTWDVVLAGILPCTSKANPEQNGRPVRVPWVDVVRTPGLHHIAVARQPAFSTSELITLQSFTKTVLKQTGTCRRVHLNAQRGTKVLLAELIAEMLVAVGRMQKTGGLDEYSGVGKVWRMPTLVFLDGLPSPVQRSSWHMTPDLRTPRDRLTFTSEQPTKRVDQPATSERATSNSMTQQRQASGQRTSNTPPSARNSMSTQQAQQSAQPGLSASQTSNATRTYPSLSGPSSITQTRVSLTSDSGANLVIANSGSIHDLGVTVTTNPITQASPFYLSQSAPSGAWGDKYSPLPPNSAQSRTSAQSLTAAALHQPAAQPAAAAGGNKPLLIPLRSPKSQPPLPVVPQSPPPGGERDAVSDAAAVTTAANGPRTDPAPPGTDPAKVLASSLEAQPGRLSETSGGSPSRPTRWSVSVSGLSAPLLGAFRVGKTPV